MINELRDKITEQIKGKQERKEELYDAISRIDNELLDLNEAMIKISDDDAFFEITPNEAFEILKMLGYEDEKEKLNIYISLISNNKEENTNLKNKNSKIDFDLPMFFQ